MALSGFDDEPMPPGTTDAAPNYLHPPLVNKGDWPKGAGDLISSAADIARWNVALMSGRVINETSLRTMLTPAAAVTGSAIYRGCKYAMGWYACEGPDYRFYQHDGVISGFMASNAIARQKNGSWMSATVMGNIDANKDISTLARSLLRGGN
jgi:CubicO group peptidase (beta-lactamase class C family)